MSADSPLPEPMVAPEVDLLGYEFMPLYGDVLFKSGFDVRASDAEFRAALNLWWSAWKQRPASSLPNDERELARLAGIRDLRTWRKVRATVMEKWVLCRDDRLYHPFLSDQACDVWIKRKVASTKGANGARKRWENNSKRMPQPIAQALPQPSYSDAPAIESDSTGNSAGNSNRSKGIYPPTPLTERSTSKPPQTSKAIAKTEQLLAEQRAWEGTPSPPTGKAPSEFLKTFTKPHSFEDIDP